MPDILEQIADALYNDENEPSILSCLQSIASTFDNAEFEQITAALENIAAELKLIRLAIAGPNQSDQQEPEKPSAPHPNLAGRSS